MSSKIFLLLFLIFRFTDSLPQSAPYPQSEFIQGINFNWSTFIRLAPGSDNWPLTWADDNHQYSAWGDGGGFGGNDILGRVSLGVARVEGSSTNFTGYNVYGGVNPENPAFIDGKSYGIISIGGILYMWVGPGSHPNNFIEARLYKSTNHAATWEANTWAFNKNDSIILPAFCQFGKDYTNSRDDYVYIYSPRYKNDSIQKPGEIDLMRVNKNQVLNRNSYEFYRGNDSFGTPQWTFDKQSRISVFKDSNGVGGNLSIIYIPGINRYILITEHGISAKGNIGIFEAPEPWGPWKTVLYQNSFGVPNNPPSNFYFNISSKWLSADGKDFVLIFAGLDVNDSWNSVQASFIISNPGSPSVPQLFSPINNSTGLPAKTNLVWLNNSNNSSYWLEVSTDSNFSSIILRDTTVIDTSFQLKELYSSSRYFWRVKAKSGNTWSEFSEVWQFSTSTLKLKLKVFLEGTYDSLSQTMSTSLNTLGYLPLWQPYYSPPWNYTGGEIVNFIPESVVDWVLIQLRDSITFNSTVASRAALLLANGIVTDMDGIRDIEFNGVKFAQYHIAVRHRNHLDIMSRNKIYLSENSPLFDFTLSPDSAYTLGGVPNTPIGGGKFGMHSGDANVDGCVDAFDHNLVIVPSLSAPFDYSKSADLNLDAKIDILDINLWNKNNGLSSQLPE